MTDGRIAALRAAVEADPSNNTLRLMLAEMLSAEGRSTEALDEYERLLHAGAIPADGLLSVGHAAAEEGRLTLARGCVEAARNSGVVEGVRQLEERIAALLQSRGLERVKADPDLPGPFVPDADPEDALTFQDVGGLDDLKKTIHRSIILPLSRPDLYERYGRKAGGGILLYGPPGCGKTLIARATAGEARLPFIRVRIEQILDPYLGMSEQNLHAVFDRARMEAPCVLFIDEVDALGYARRRQTGSSTRALADLLLQELDRGGSSNDRVLVLASTNAPWDVDEALLRPGRFDHRIFVPPPDEGARRRIFEVALRSVPAEDVDLKTMARATPLFSGADIRAAVERVVDALIDRALESDTELPVTGDRLLRAIETMRPTTLDWLQRARSYVEFANETGRYSEVADFLGSRDVRKRLKGESR